MSALLNTLSREIGRVRSIKTYALLLTLLPMFAMVFFLSLFGEGVPRKFYVAVVDEDLSTLSRKVVEMIQASPETAVRYATSSTREAYGQLLQGEVDAIVVIPSHFERDVMGLIPTSIAAYTTGANILANGLITKGLTTAISTFAAGVRIEHLLGRGLSAEQAIQQSQIIAMENHTLFNPYTNYDYYLSPVFLPMMLLIFTTLATTFAIGSELRDGTASEWIATAEGSIGIALVAKLLPTVAAMTALWSVMFAMLFGYVGVPLHGNALLLFMAGIVLIISYISIAIFIITSTANLRFALSLGGGYAVMAFSLSGLTFPSIAMSAAMRWFGHLFPFTYFVRLLIDQSMRGAPVAYSLSDIAAMLLFTVPAILSLPRLRKIATNSIYWGKI